MKKAKNSLGLSFLLLLFAVSCAKIESRQSSSGVTTGEVLFNSAKTVLDNSCVSCHREGGASVSFDLSSPSDFVARGLINPGNPRASKLITRLKNYDGDGTSKNMPPVGQISDSDYQKLYSWILNVASDTTPFQCSGEDFSTSSLVAKNAKRLSVRQYKNSLIDLLDVALSRSQAQQIVEAVLGQFPLPQDTGDHFKRENNAFTGQHADAYFEVANKLAGDLSSQHLQALVSSFVNLDQRNCSNLNVSSLSSACREAFIHNFVSRAFRRPVRVASLGLSTLTNQSIDELSEYSGEYSNLSTQEGTNNLLFRIFMSPHFLFQIEDQNLLADQNLGNNTYEVSPYVYASRLTYAFWNSLPDQGLWSLLETENFTSDESYLRLLNYVLSQKSRLDDSMREYMYDWLKLSRTPIFNVNSKFGILAPGVSFNENLRQDMIKEVEEFGSYIFTSGGSFEDLFVDNTSFARSSDLMSLYNQNTPAPSYANTTSSNSVKFSPGTRAGILTRAAMLVSGSELSNPILRGAHIRKDLLCLDLGTPPSNALDVFNNTNTDNFLSTREKTDIKTSAPSCVGCHNLINPIGFGLSNFNALGMFDVRETVFRENQDSIEGYINIDSSVDLSDVLGSGVQANNPVEFSRVLSEQEGARACFSKKFLEFAMTRSVTTENDNCKLNKVYNQLGAEGSLADMLRVTGLEREFRVRKIEN